MIKDDQQRLLAPFLPAALEIQHSPPHPLARVMAGSMMLFFALLVLWASCSKTDMVAVAEGRVIPSSRVKQIQPLEKGVVQAIFVHEGQRVKTGDALIAFDRTRSGAERERIAGEVSKTAQGLARQQAFYRRLQQQPDVPAGDPLQQALLEQEWLQYQAALAGLHSQRDSLSAEREANLAVMRKLDATLPMVSQRAADMRQLAARKLVAQSQYLEQETLRINQQADLAAAEARDGQLAADILGSEQQIAALQAKTRADVLSAITLAERQLASLQEQLTQASDLDARQVLYAPVDGTVKDLAVNTVGGVVVEAQQLMLLVPDDAPLEVEAWLLNRDIGFVQDQAAVVIKVHTFPFTRYGTLAGTVMQVSRDAVADERDAARGGLRYRLRVQLAQDALQVDERVVRLVPGMQVSAEIITGQRRLIDYFLAPLMQRAQESVRER